MRPDEEELLASWLAHRKAEAKVLIYFEKSVDDPERAWQGIRRLMAVPTTKSFLKMLGIGPLSDFLRSYGSLMIDRLEQVVAVEPRLRTCLDYVSMLLMPEDIWQRIVRAANNNIWLHMGPASDRHNEECPGS